jgi:hypothetical protein
LEERGNALEVSISECASRTVEVERQRAEITQLKRENGELLERLITMKETEAEKYNEIHNMLAEAEKKKQAADVYKPGSATRGSSGLSAGMMSDVLTSGGGGIQIKSCIPSAPKHNIVAHERSEVISPFSALYPGLFFSPPASLFPSPPHFTFPHLLSLPSLDPKFASSFRRYTPWRTTPAAQCF